MRWRQRFFEKRMSRSLDSSWLDHTLFYVNFSSASKLDESDEVVQRFVVFLSGSKKARLSSLMKQTIYTVEGLLGIAVQMFTLETLGSSCTWFKLKQVFKPFSNHFVQPARWFCPDSWIQGTTSESIRDTQDWLQLSAIAKTWHQT